MSGKTASAGNGPGHDGRRVCAALRRYGRAVAHEIARTGRPEAVESLLLSSEAAEARLRASLDQLDVVPAAPGRRIRRGSIGYASSSGSRDGEGGS